LKLRELADRLNCRLEGDGDIDIERVAGIESAGPGDLTFFANPKYATHLRATRASAVILAPRQPQGCTGNRISRRRPLSHAMRR
jgi:UDP-3-O-[3-hydroxymyristoyl] glucosamine N-acyltransferase